MEFPQSRIVIAKGDTTIYGRLIRVGGTTPRATIVLRSGRHLYVKLNESMAVEIATKGRLYKDVGIEGEATWRIDTWEIVAFRAKRIAAYEPHNTNLVETFRELREASQGRWDHVDPEQCARDLRS